MTYSKILSTCFICLFIAACDTPEHPAPVKKTPATKIIPEKTTGQKTPKQETVKQEATTIKPRPAVNLSIDNITIEQQRDDSLFDKNEGHTQKNTAMFETLSKGQAESNINVSGKLFTDQNMLDNEEYLNSVNGLQINIEGNFE